MTESNQRISRRRVLAGAGVGAAAVWAAPAITTLASASAAGSCITVYQTLLGELKNQPTTYVAPVALTFSNGNQLNITQGNANLTGPNTIFTAGYPPVACIDLLGEGQGGVLTTVLQTDSLQPGTYTVELQIGGTYPVNVPANDSVVVSLGGVLFNLALGAGAPITTYSQSTTVTTAGPLTLTATSATSDNVGMFLAGIRICKTN